MGNTSAGSAGMGMGMGAMGGGAASGVPGASEAAYRSQNYVSGVFGDTTPSSADKIAGSKANVFGAGKKYAQEDQANKDAAMENAGMAGSNDPAAEHPVMQALAKMALDRQKAAQARAAGTSPYPPPAQVPPLGAGGANQAGFDWSMLLNQGGM